MTAIRSEFTCAETAGVVRRALAAAFPGTRFKVRTNRYAGGASIRVTWTDGPAEAAVNPLLARFRSGDDLAAGHAPERPAHRDGSGAGVRYGADRITLHRLLSDAYHAQLAALATGLLGGDPETCGYVSAMKTSYGTFGGGTGPDLMLWLADRVQPRSVGDRLFYVAGYLRKIARNPGYLSTGGAAQIREGLRLMIKKYPAESPWNDHAERTITYLASPGVAAEGAVTALTALRALA